jgi:hypothetical protein
MNSVAHGPSARRTPTRKGRIPPESTLATPDSAAILNTMESSGRCPRGSGLDDQTTRRRARLPKLSPIRRTMTADLHRGERSSRTASSQRGSTC